MQIIEDLKRTSALTLSYFDLPEADLEKSYGPGKWTVRQLLHHMTDADTVLYDRIRRAISEPKSVVWAFDQDKWAQALNYQSFPLAINKGIFAATRAAVIFLAQSHYENAAQKTFIHSETGLRTLKDEFDKVVWHNQGHLDQIKKALAS
ncbi:MAG: DinB family protein [Saprospiraceae bacterium]